MCEGSRLYYTGNAERKGYANRDVCVLSRVISKSEDSETKEKKNPDITVYGKEGILCALCSCCGFACDSDGCRSFSGRIWGSAVIPGFYESVSGDRDRDIGTVRKGIVMIQTGGGEVMGVFPNLAPRDKTDYYKVIRWLISRRLAYVLVTSVIFLCICLLVLMNPPEWIGDRGYHVYNYNSFLLRFRTGNVGIRGMDGHLAYVGTVSKGGVNGKGTLYRKDGQTVYKGAFRGNAYHGQGTLYQNSGTLEYVGEFVSGVKQGEGELYNENNSLIYKGNFQNDQIVYEELIGKKTEEISEKYLGRRIVYTKSKEICVGMPEIQALYYGSDGTDTLDGAWSAGGIYILKSSITTGGKTFTKMEEVTEYFGDPVYRGNTFASFSEITAMELLDESILFQNRPQMSTSSELKDVYEVDAVPSDYQIYIYTYEMDGIQYTFFTESTYDGFGFYLMERS